MRENGCWDIESVNIGRRDPTDFLRGLREIKLISRIETRESNKRHGGIIIICVSKTYYLSVFEKDMRLMCVYTYFSEFILSRAIISFDKFRDFNIWFTCFN